MRRLLVAAVAVVLVALVGCSEEGPKAESAVKPSVTQRPASAETSTVTPAPVGESAKAFIRRWFQAQDRMLQTGDTGQYRIMAARCDDCQASADHIASIRKKGGTIRFRGSKVRSIRPIGDHGGEHYEVELYVGPTRYRPEVGAAEKRLKGGNDKFHVVLENRMDEWQVTHLMRRAG